ncbi:MAG: hypothetical protein ABII18_08455 [bacterium]|nr:hypothetical protein [bacterium]MBU1918988.1 hypothetical protein [bacterium]
MIKIVKNIFLSCVLVVVFFGIVHCGGTAATGGTTTIGTISGNPTIPENNVMPDFDEAIPDTALDGTAETGASVSYLTSQIKYLTGPSALWEDIFLFGGMEAARDHRTNFEILGTEVKAQLEARGIEKVTDETQLFELDPIEFLDGIASFTVELVLDNDPEFVRMYISDQETGEYVGTYVFTTDDEGDPFRGIIVMIDPDTLTAEQTESKRYVGIAYDFSDPSMHLMTMRVEEYHPNRDYYITYHIHYQCNVLTEQCIGEYVDIQSDPPERQISYALRFSWNEETKDICIAEVAYEGNEFVMEETQHFTGPGIPEEIDVVEGLCEIDEPYWYDHFYVVGDLPVRYEDVEGGGGTTYDIFNSDNVEGYDILTPERIETWLSAEEF